MVPAKQQSESSVIPEISVVIPVFQAAGCVSLLIERLHTTLAQLTPTYEIILVDDGSSDDSWREILKHTGKTVIGIKLSRNFGQHYAITAGLDASRGNWVVVMDCDLQDPPEIIADLYAKAKQGNKIVFARKKTEKTSYLDRLTSKLFYRSLGLISKIEIDEGLTNFSIASRQVVNTICSMRERMRFYGGMIFWAGYSYAVIDYDRAERASGESTYTLVKRLRLAVRNLFAYSSLPLEYCTYLGLFVMLLAMAYVCWICVSYYIYHAAPSGWSSLAALVGFFGGFFSFQLGLMGLYIGQNMEESRRRPLYVIDEQTGESLS